MQSTRGSAIDGPTPVFAARWTSTSIPSATRRTKSASQMSPATSSMLGKSTEAEPMVRSCRESSSLKDPISDRSSRVPTDRLSNTRTMSLGRAKSSRIKVRPIKPQPPVTSHRMVSSPSHTRKDALDHDVVAMPKNVLQHRRNDIVCHEVRLEAEVHQAVMDGIVVVLLHFLARVVEVLHIDPKAHSPAHPLDPIGELVNCIGFGELIENAQLPR